MSVAIARPNPKKYPFNYHVYKVGVFYHDFENFIDAEAYLCGQFPDHIVEPEWTMREGANGARPTKLCVTLGVKRRINNLTSRMHETEDDQEAARLKATLDELVSNQVMIARERFAYEKAMIEYMEAKGFRLELGYLCPKCNALLYHRDDVFKCVACRMTFTDKSELACVCRHE